MQNGQLSDLKFLMDFLHSDRHNKVESMAILPHLFHL
jgi:hypothetical protein